MRSRVVFQDTSTALIKQPNETSIPFSSYSHGGINPLGILITWLISLSTDPQNLWLIWIHAAGTRVVWIRSNILRSVGWAAGLWMMDDGWWSWQIESSTIYGSHSMYDTCSSLSLYCISRILWQRNCQNVKKKKKKIHS